jgi:orotidine-5'-phosphate decarboxylase
VRAEARPAGAALVNVSRSILYASSGPDFAAAARGKAHDLLAPRLDLEPATEARP